MDCADRFTVAGPACDVWAWNSVFRRFLRWAVAGVFERLFKA
jgi:hypothetical protein